MLHWGSSTLVAGVGETYHTDVGRRADTTIPWKYYTVVDGDLAVLTGDEQTDVDDADETAEAAVPLIRRVGLSAPEVLGDAELAINVDSYRTRMTTEEDRTLAAGTQGLLKKIVNASAGSIDVVCSPRLRGAATDILRLAAGEQTILLYHAPTMGLARWIAIDGTITLV